MTETAPGSLGPHAVIEEAAQLHVGASARLSDQRAGEVCDSPSGADRHHGEDGGAEQQYGGHQIGEKTATDRDALGQHLLLLRPIP